MRPIDADALLKGKEDHEMISTHLIFNAPTLKVIKADVLDKIRADIIDLAEGWNGMQAKNVPLGAVLKVIDKHTSRKEK